MESKDKKQTFCGGCYLEECVDECGSIESIAVSYVPEGVCVNVTAKLPYVYRRAYMHP